MPDKLAQNTATGCSKHPHEPTGGLMRFRIFMLPAVLLLLMGFAVTPRRGFAQGSVTATLSGTVSDSSGAVVPGATITAKNKGTASTTTAVSGADGLFTIPALEPGVYTVTVTLQGFATAVLENI